MTATAAMAAPVRPPAALTISRQRFLAWGIVAIGGFIASVVAVPILTAIIAPALKKHASEWLELGTMADFKVDQPTGVDLSLTRKDGWTERTNRATVWVVVNRDTTLTVFSGKCTHLGCAVAWKSDAQEFFSPCHGGWFARDGTVLGGPPPRPLDVLPTKVEGGKILVQYKEYRLGVPEKLDL